MSKWIRTYCGIVTNDYTDICFKNGGMFMLKSKNSYPIKKTGNNLIDVLEIDKDIFVHKKTLEPYIYYDYHSKKNEIVLRGLSTDEFIECSIDDLIKDFDVITHEQYMPLAQEIYNDI